MTELIDQYSRWRTRPVPYAPTGQPDSGTWNLLLYIPNVTDHSFQGAVQNELNTFAHLELCRDLDGQFQSTQMRGNVAAAKLMYDFDSSISLGHILVQNFEIGEPYGTSLDMNWLGDALFTNFGSGWSGPLGGRFGTDFTLTTKKEQLFRAIDLATTAWKVRWRFMYRHINTKRTLFNENVPRYRNAPDRMKAVNDKVHQAEYIRDSVIAEADGDFFGDGVGRPREYQTMHEGTYNVKWNVTRHMRDAIAGYVAAHPDIRNIYIWIAEYIDQFILWRDATMSLLMKGSRRTPKTVRWVRTAHLAYTDTVRCLEDLSEEVQRSGMIRRPAWKYNIKISYYYP
ncbi:hypothetical protein F4860DRAFT_23478 [Xylaria cubensis]|nr:hypothetical protein F4860DRAFT_23478 [Xylaria cubensis]